MDSDNSIGVEPVDEIEGKAEFTIDLSPLDEEEAEFVTMLVKRNERLQNMLVVLYKSYEQSFSYIRMLELTIASITLIAAMGVLISEVFSWWLTIPLVIGSGLMVVNLLSSTKLDPPFDPDLIDREYARLGRPGDVLDSDPSDSE